MKKYITILLGLILISLLTTAIFFEIKLKDLRKENLELLSHEENIGLDKIIQMNFNVEKDNIARIGVANSRHYEITNQNNIKQILEILNGITFERCNKNSNELGFICKVAIYTESDDELLDFTILSNDCIKIKNIEYKAINKSIDYDKITCFLGGN